MAPKKWCPRCSEWVLVRVSKYYCFLGHLLVTKKQTW